MFSSAVLTKQVGDDIAAAEFFNEPDMPVYGGAPTHYNAADYARDFAIFREFAKANAPEMAIVGSRNRHWRMPSISGKTSRDQCPGVAGDLLVFLRGENENPATRRGIVDGVVR